MTTPLPTLPVVIALLLAGCGGTGPVEPACPSVPAYAGPPLHEPPPADVFPSPAAAPGSGTKPSVPGDVAAALDARVASLLRQTGAPAIDAALDVPGLGRWTTTQGLARVSPPEAATDTTPFYWASVAKSLTAVLVLQLIDKGRLGPEDRLARWYPDMPNADGITLAQLLTHTSGLATNPSPANPAPATPREWLAAAAATPAIACPGRVASYSNIGYQLLGHIVQRVEAQAFDEVLQRRVAGPLGLEQRFGQGVIWMEWTDHRGARRSWLGHLGGVPGANAMVAYDPALRTYVAVAVNSDVPAPAVANALLDEFAGWRAVHAPR